MQSQLVGDEYITRRAVSDISVFSFCILCCFLRLKVNEPSASALDVLGDVWFSTMYLHSGRTARHLTYVFEQIHAAPSLKYVESRALVGQPFFVILLFFISRFEQTSHRCMRFATSRTVVQHEWTKNYEYNKDIKCPLHVNTLLVIVYSKKRDIGKLDASKNAGLNKTQISRSAGGKSAPRVRSKLSSCETDLGARNVTEDTNLSGECVFA